MALDGDRLQRPLRLLLQTGPHDCPSYVCGLAMRLCVAGQSEPQVIRPDALADGLTLLAKARARRAFGADWGHAPTRPVVT